MADSAKNRYVKSYWQYYLSLEKRFARTEEYVTFDADNDKAFSIEYLALMQSVCSEVDVVGKAIASHFEPTLKVEKTNIQKWSYFLQCHLSEVVDTEVRFLRERTITPWRNWRLEERTNKKGSLYYAYARGSSSPEWWRAYNKVKHARTSVDDGAINYKLANQKNVMTSLAALYVLHRLMLIRLDADAYPTLERSRLFSMPGRRDEVRTGTFVDSTGRFVFYTST